MRGLAFGILDPRGERYRLARLHQRECPACRAYVLSLRGLAAVLPLPALPWGLGMGAAAGAGAGASAATTAGTGAGVGSSGVGLTSAGAAGVGGAGGGWLLTGGSVGAKLAVSCLLALSVGCVALTIPHNPAGTSHRHRPVHAPPPARVYLASAPTGTGAGLGQAGLGSAATAGSSTTAASRASRPAITAAASARQAQREFGPEQPPSGSATAVASTPHTTATARAASTRAASTRTASTPVSVPRESATRASPSHAEREFGP
jgi:hypothetical protein